MQRTARPTKIPVRFLYPVERVTPCALLAFALRALCLLQAGRMHHVEIYLENELQLRFPLPVIQVQQRPPG